MLLGLWGVATTWCAGCQLGETLPPRPVVPPREALVNQQASDGCTRFALKVVNGVARVEALYNTNGCHTDELQLLADSAPTYTAATGTLRVPIVLKNVGGVAVMAPARIRFNADSSQFLNAQGQVIAGTPNILATNYDTANAGGRNGQWRYDTVLAVSGQPQLLLPGASSRRKWLEFTGSDWTQAVRIKVPTVATQVGGVVPAVPPDAEPSFATDSTYIVRNPSDGGFDFVKDLIEVEFHLASTVADRTAAIARVGGVVVGGYPLSGTLIGARYLVRLPPSAPGAEVANIAAAERLLRLHAAVRRAVRYSFVPLRASYRRPTDGSGWSHADWATTPSAVLAPAPWRPTWANAAVRIPLAWGCSVGDSATRIGVLDIGFTLATGSDVALNVASARNAALNGDTAARHGNWVASVLGARGDNATGISGVMWRAGMHLFDPSAVDSSTGAPFYINGKRQVPWPRVYTGFVSLLSSNAAVVNISLGADTTPTFQVSDTSSLHIAESYMGTFGFVASNAVSDPLIVVSSGNVRQGDPRESVWPLLKDSLHDRVLVVAAMRRNGTLLSARVGSNYIDIAAPGDSVIVLDPTLGQVLATGASVATPIVSGLAGLLRSFDPRLTAAQVRQLILDGAIQGGRTSGAYPVVDAYQTMKLAAARPGAPLCGNPIAYTAAVDTINSTSTITVNAKRVAGPGGFEPLTTFSVPGTNGAPVYLPHGGKQILVDLGDGLGLHRVAQHNGTSWQTLAAPWPIATDSSVSGVTWSSRGWTHGGDTAFYAIKTANPGFLTSNVSFALWSNGSLGSPLTTKPDLADRWTPIGGTLSTGAAGFGGTISPTGTFGIGFVTDGGAVKSYRFYKISVPSGADSLLFTDVLDIDPAYPATYSGPAPALGLTISEDGSEFWYTAPVQNSSYYYGCILKRYSLTLRQFVSVDALPSGGSLSACTPTSLAWQGAAARTAGRRLRP